MEIFDDVEDGVVSDDSEMLGIKIIVPPITGEAKLRPDVSAVDVKPPAISISSCNMRELFILYTPGELISPFGACWLVTFDKYL